MCWISRADGCERCGAVPPLLDLVDRAEALVDREEFAVEPGGLQLGARQVMR